MTRTILDRLAKAGGLTAVMALFLAAGAQAAVLQGYVQETETVATPVTQTANTSITDTLPQDLEGSWQCLTTVTHSLVDTVPVGNKVISRVDFVRSLDGRLEARAMQPGWMEGKAHVTNYGQQVVIDRSSYYMPDGANGAWACRSRDRYSLIERDKVMCSSDVDQYIGGAYIGRYQTSSVLVRMRDDVAFNK